MWNKYKNSSKNKRKSLTKKESLIIISRLYSPFPVQHGTGSRMLDTEPREMICE